MLKSFALGIVVTAAALVTPAAAENLQVGVLTCDVSKGTSFFVTQKQSMRCTFKHTDGTVERYGGRISVDAPDAGGTRFTVWLRFEPLGH